MVIEYIADMDGDGLNDLVYTSNVYYCIWGILENEGDLIFTDHIIFDDGMGVEVRHVPVIQNDKEINVDISSLPAGLYFVVMKVENREVAEGKFLVLR